MGIAIMQFMRQLKLFPSLKKKRLSRSLQVQYWQRQETTLMLMLIDTDPLFLITIWLTCHIICYYYVSRRARIALASVWSDWNFYVFCLKNSTRQKLGGIVAHSLWRPLTSVNTDIKLEICCWLKHSYSHCTGVHLRSESDSTACQRLQNIMKEWLTEATHTHWAVDVQQRSRCFKGQYFCNK